VLVQFKQIEGSFDSWLPKDKGRPASLHVPIEEIRVAMFWGRAGPRPRAATSDAHGQNERSCRACLRDAHADFVRLGKPEVPVTIDSTRACRGRRSST